MPWNSPGGSKDDDPWGQKSNNQGPPDLDEVFRNLTKKFGGIFGSGSSGGSKKPKPGRSYIWLVVVAAVAVWGIYDKFGFYTVNQAERGVELRLGKFTRTTTAGLNWHWPFPIESVELVNVDEVREVSNKTSMLTQDENIVEVSLEAQYKIKNARDYLFNVKNIDETIKDVSEAAMRLMIGDRSFIEVIQTERVAIADQAKDYMQETLDKYKTGVSVQLVQLQGVVPPEPVSDSFNEVNRAKQDQETLINQAKQGYNKQIYR